MAAALAWLAGMGGSAAVQAWGPVALVVVGPAMVAGLLAMGVLQWLVLRRHVPGSGRWVPVTSAAWLVGVLIPVAALSAVPNGWPPTVHVTVGVAGCSGDGCHRRPAHRDDAAPAAQPGLISGRFRHLEA